MANGNNCKGIKNIMVTIHRYIKRIIISNYYEDIKFGAIFHYSYILSLKIIRIDKAIINNRHFSLDFLEIFIVSTCNDSLFHIISHRLESIKNVFHTGKIIRM